MLIPFHRLTKEQFIALSKSIVIIFPSEIPEAYFVPSQRNQLARGKLWDAYNNFRTKLSLAGIIQRRNKINRKIDVCEQSSVNSEEVFNLNLITNEFNNWLETLNVWKETYNVRKAELSKLGVDQYIDKYKALYQPNANELVR